MRPKSSTENFKALFGKLQKTSISKNKAPKEQPTTPNQLQVPENHEEMKKSSRSQFSSASNGKAGKKLGNAFGLTKEE
jgi:hypothetical protein